ncbi:MAG: PEP-CTERM sorting domain-containing protein [Kiritimatiellae bacterium]|nr:PEP-CTERM sorting domain-containing protein [Kiritimatiellia bacterium]
MKRIMITMCMIAFAICTQAASINWGGFIGNSQGAGGAMAGTGAYATLIFMGASMPAGSVDTWDSTTGLSNLGGEVMATHAITSSEALTNYSFADGFTRSDSAGGVNGYWMMAVYDPTQTEQYFGWYSAEITGVSDTSPAADFKLESGWTAGQYLDGGAQLEVVPEPTSMALLSLGIAALGLRRKFRK